MSNQRFKHIASWAEKIAGLALALAMVSLPVTSLPILSKLTGGNMVAPPSIVFVFLAGVLWIPFFVLGKGGLPVETGPFLAFGAIACLASLVAFFLPVQTYKGHTLVNEEMSALITLASALVVYLVVSVWYQDESRLKTALKLLNMGGLAIVIWGFAQIVVIYFFHSNYPDWMERIHGLFSIRSLSSITYGKRITGFAIEPSWLAHQLNILYLPFWLAATVTGYSAHTRRFLRLSAENALLVGGIVLLAFSWSRIGLLAFLLAAAFLVVRLSAYLAKRIVQKLGRSSQGERTSRRLFEFSIVAGLLFLYGAVATSFTFAISRLDPRLARIFNSSVFSTNPFDLARSLVFAERLIYWQTGWNIFAHYPLLGVGLGNAGFFFQSNLPFQGQMLEEIQNVTSGASFLLNIKSMWVRLLAETGIAGFSIFSAWLYILWLANRFLRNNPSPLLKVIGWMGALAIIAFLAEGFSVDSFALPYLWISLGLVTATSSMVRKNTEAN